MPRTFSILDRTITVFAEDMIPLEATLAPGTVLGDFEILEKLGGGGMGEVFRARQRSLDRDVALKVLAQANRWRADTVQRFLKEARNCGQIDHAGVVTAFDVGEENGIYYLAMSLVEGDNLGRHVEKCGPLAEAEALRIIARVANVLAYTWEQHELLHRDLKPTNIMIDASGRVKVIDFGLSTILEEAGWLTCTRVVMGSPNYMCPEQTFGSRSLDCSCDIYSLGMTLFFLLTGVTPFEAPNARAVMSRQRLEPLPHPESVAGIKVSVACHKLIQQMTSKQRPSRLRNWPTCLEALRRVRNGQPPPLIDSTATGPSAPTHFWRGWWGRKRPR